jgi:hypothetical protein
LHVYADTLTVLSDFQNLWSPHTEPHVFRDLARWMTSLNERHTVVINSLADALVLLPVQALARRTRAHALATAICRTHVSTSLLLQVSMRLHMSLHYKCA